MTLYDFLEDHVINVRGLPTIVTDLFKPYEQEWEAYQESKIEYDDNVTDCPLLHDPIFRASVEGAKAVLYTINVMGSQTPDIHHQVGQGVMDIRHQSNGCMLSFIQRDQTYFRLNEIGQLIMTATEFDHQREAVITGLVTYDALRQIHRVTIIESFDNKMRVLRNRNVVLANTEGATLMLTYKHDERRVLIDNISQQPAQTVANITLQETEVF